MDLRAYCMSDGALYLYISCILIPELNPIREIALRGRCLQLTLSGFIPTLSRVADVDCVPPQHPSISSVSPDNRLLPLPTAPATSSASPSTFPLRRPHALYEFIFFQAKKAIYVFRTIAVALNVFFYNLHFIPVQALYLSHKQNILQKIPSILSQQLLKRLLSK